MVWRHDWVIRNLSRKRKEMERVDYTGKMMQNELKEAAS